MFRFEIDIFTFCVLERKNREGVSDYNIFATILICQSSRVTGHYLVMSLLQGMRHVTYEICICCRD